MSTAAESTTTAPLEAEILTEWIAIRRKLIVDEGCVVRAGAGRTIEVQLVNRPGHVFQPLTGPDGKRCFATDEERDQVLARLQGSTK